MDEQVLFEQFHETYDFEPRAGSFELLRSTLLSSQVRVRPRSKFGLRKLSPRSMRLLAVATLFAVSVAATGAFIAIQQYTHRAVPVVPPPTRSPSGTCSQGLQMAGLHMATENVGWRSASRTTDGGVTWRDVSPPRLPNATKGGGTICILDADHAWTTQTTGTSLGLPDHIVVFATDDGGQTWQKGQPVALPGASPAPGQPLVYVTVALDFIDLQHGWMVTDTSASSSTPFVRTLYATSDSGLHWRIVTSESPSTGSVLGKTAVACAESGITFISPDHGWITWDCSQTFGPAPNQYGGLAVIATEDGGHSWLPVRVPLYPTGSDQICSASPPLFSGKQGLLPVSCAGVGHTGLGTAIFRTDDTGSTWSIVSLPFFAEVSQLDFLDVSTGFAFSYGGRSNDLYRTTDGGQNWALIKQGLFSGHSVHEYQFIDTTTGFAYTSPLAGPPWKTTDGGLTWSLACASRSLPANVICAPPPPFP